MLTKITIRNFKALVDVKIDLGRAVVFIGPNNSGKTTALQALALWQYGLTEWLSKRGKTSTADKRPGVSLNRRDLIALPVPQSNLLWHALETRHVKRTNGKPDTENVRIEIIVDGTDDKSGSEWSCGLEFDYANEESIYCRPLRLDESSPPRRMPVPDAATLTRLAFLPPMSGLAATEPKLERGRIDVLLGEGQTAQVLRNLCHLIADGEEGARSWADLTHSIYKFFGIRVDPPKYNSARGEITMTYTDQRGTSLDISSAGRGLQQTLLLLAHIYANPNTVLLLDEPDAHLEILRQRQIYQVLSDLTAEKGSQLICASHSEVVLNEAAERDVVVAFIGRNPHRVDDRGQQVRKSLTQIGYDQYYQAELRRWVLYLEGSTDLAVLRSFAETLGHSALDSLSSPFVHYVGNQPNKAADHYSGLKEALPSLLGYALFDRLGRDLRFPEGLSGHSWHRNEIENYLCTRNVLMAHSRVGTSDDLIGMADRSLKEEAMTKAIGRVEEAQKVLGKDIWSNDIKASDEVLDVIFKNYFELLKSPTLFRKSDYHELAKLVPKDQIDNEIVQVLDGILDVSRRANPLGVV